MSEPRSKCCGDNNKIGLKQEELLEQLDAIFIGYILFLIKGRQQKKREEIKNSEFLKHKKQAFEQIKERIQSYAEHQELTASYIDIVIDLYDQLEQKKPEVTEKFIGEKAIEIYNYLYYETFNLNQAIDFIRSLVGEIQGKKLRPTEVREKEKEEGK